MSTRGGDDPGAGNAGKAGDEVGAVDAELRLAAPAKINLGLRIVGRRDDGYHLLESLFAPIDWADDVVIRWRAGGGRSVSLRVDVEEAEGVVSADAIPSGPENLVHRAGARFLEVANLSGALALHLTKRLPAGAGLGGGSSDAGAVLRGLAEMFPGAVPDAALARIALGLGADVPFFLDPRPSWVGGIGERVEPLADFPALILVLANPGVPLATPKVFRAWAAAHAVVPAGVEGAVRAALAAWSKVQEAGSRESAAALGHLLENDLEAPAIELVPEIGVLLGRLSELGAVARSMSGSGASVFGVFDSEETARAAAERMNAEGPGWARVARVSVARS